MRNRYLLSAVVVTVLGIGVGAQEPAVSVLGPGVSAPTFSLPSLDGERVTLRTFCGDTLLKPHINKIRQVVILNFWATYCKPCQKEIPELITFAQKHAQDNVKVILVNIDKEGASLVAPFVKEKGYTLPVLLDPYKKTSARYGVQSLPALFLIDPFGIIRYSSVGYDEGESLDQKLERILADARIGKSVGSDLSGGEAVSVKNDSVPAPSPVTPKPPVIVNPKARWEAIIKVECGTPVTSVADSLGVKPEEIRTWYEELKKAALSLWEKKP
jgi:thiol-disulfide isomerase/thioredoxin